MAKPTKSEIEQTDREYDPKKHQIAVLAVHTVIHTPIYAADTEGNSIGQIIDEVLRRQNGSPRKVVLDFVGSEDD